MMTILDNVTIPPYLEAANRISDELELLGFVTDEVSKSYGLVERISKIIQRTIEKNTIFSYDDMYCRFRTNVTDKELDGAILEYCESSYDQLSSMDGWDEDLQNQIT